MRQQIEEQAYLLHCSVVDAVSMLVTLCIHDLVQNSQLILQHDENVLCLHQILYLTPLLKRRSLGPLGRLESFSKHFSESREGMEEEPPKGIDVPGA